MKKKISQKKVKLFQEFVVAFFKKNGRTLPWRRTKNPYHILVSEIMLQQTQVDRTIPKFKEFIRRFPTVQKLAKAPKREVLLTWQGMGYNRRALNLQKAAQAIVSHHKGKVPKTVEALAELPGIGPYTARAIMAFAFNKPVVLIETNVRTVYLHHFFPKLQKVHDEQLLPIIEQTVDMKNTRQWYSALMDYGSYLKRSLPNPSRRSAHHVRQPKFEGSLRQTRGAVVRHILRARKATYLSIKNAVGIDDIRLKKGLQALLDDGVLHKEGISYSLVE